MRRASRRLRAFGAVIVVSVCVLVAATMALLAEGSAPARVAAPSAVRNPKVRALVRILGVLRRTQTPADRAPDLFADASSDGLTPVRSLQRLATRTSWGARVYLVPLYKTSAHGLPLNPSRGGIGISVNGRGGGCCETAVQVEAGQAYADGIHPWALIMVAPDGVARISVALRGRPGQRPPPIVTGAVHSNVAAVRLRYDAMSGPGDLITWYSASGAVIKSFYP
jgi:hypothetical protein